MKTVRFAVITMILLLITTCSVTGTVKCQDRQGSAADARYCRAVENEYIGQIREKLETQGYENAGITMTKITDDSETKAYTVLIHHRRMDRLSDDRRRELTDTLQETEFPMENCSFSYEFLENN